MWGIIPAAGAGSRIQPLAFSKELLPVGCRMEGETERPRAVSEYVIERMLSAGADKICFVISPGKSDILAYYGGGLGGAAFAYVVQPKPAGLCDALFCAAPFISPEEHVLIGLPDTVWFPMDALGNLPDNQLSLLTFPVEHPEFFDAVVTDSQGRVIEIQVKKREATSNWIWGAFKMPGTVFHALHELWLDRGERDEFMGSLLNEFLREGHTAWSVPAGTSYVDIGTLHGYRNAINLLSNRNEDCDVPGLDCASPTPIRHREPILTASRPS